MVLEHALWQGGPALPRGRTVGARLEFAFGQGGVSAGIVTGPVVCPARWHRHQPLEALAVVTLSVLGHLAAL